MSHHLPPMRFRLRSALPVIGAKAEHLLAANHLLMHHPREGTTPRHRPVRRKRPHHRQCQSQPALGRRPIRTGGKPKTAVLQHLIAALHPRQGALPERTVAIPYRSRPQCPRQITGKAIAHPISFRLRSANYSQRRWALILRPSPSVRTPLPNGRRRAWRLMHSRLARRSPCRPV